MLRSLGFMFPQHDCVLCRGTPDHGYGCTRPSISPAYIQHNQHPNIEILTNTHVMDVEGQAGDFTVSLRQEPRYVDPLRCINCGYCAEVCPVELPDQYQQGMVDAQSRLQGCARAAPDAYVIDKGPYCDDCGKCVEVCPSQAIDLDEQPRLLLRRSRRDHPGLGFQVYDPTELDELGYGRYPNVLKRHAVRAPGQPLRSNRRHRAAPIRSRSTTLDCLAAVHRLTRPEEHLLLVDLLHVRHQRSHACQAAPGRRGRMQRLHHGRARLQQRIQHLLRNAPASSMASNTCAAVYLPSSEDPATHDLILHYADPNGQLHQERFEMVVLATGLQPPDSARHFTQMLDLELNEYGFCNTDKFTPLQTTHPGVFVCGAFSSPKEISRRSSTPAAQPAR